MATLDMLPAKLDLVLYQGDTFRMTITVKNQDGSPANITGATATAQIRLAPEDTTVQAPIGCTIATNVISLVLLAADAARLIPGEAFWDCQLAMPDIRTLVYGRVKINPEVTR
jgi:hypothetical protein